MEACKGASILSTLVSTSLSGLLIQAYIYPRPTSFMERFSVPLQFPWRFLIFEKSSLSTTPSCTVPSLSFFDRLINISGGLHLEGDGVGDGRHLHGIGYSNGWLLWVLIFGRGSPFMLLTHLSHDSMLSGSVIDACSLQRLEVVFSVAYGFLSTGGLSWFTRDELEWERLHE